MNSNAIKHDDWKVSLPELSLACRILSPHLNLRDDENRRVQWDLQPRVIRYYTTLGLLDRACEKRGRNMMYGVRHLYQLLAIKHLQARGFSLAQIQSQLLGASNQELIEQLGLPEAWDEMLCEHRLQSQVSKAEELPGPDRREEFWRQAPQRPPKPPPPLPVEEGVAKVCFRLAQGVEVLIPQDIWDRLEPDDWQEWFRQVPS